jgi:hypothetical protein
MKIEKFNEKVNTSRFINFINDQRDINKDTIYYFKEMHPEIVKAKGYDPNDIYAISGIYTNPDRTKTITIEFNIHKVDYSSINLILDERKDYINYINNTDFYIKLSKYNI